jgi:Cu-Zn family superoxide dismutase
MKLALVLTLLCCISSGLGAAVQLGTCYLKGTTADPTIAGTVTFTYVAANQVRVDVDVAGITLSTGAEHGLHVHQYGDISDPASVSTASHWNPANVAHACPPNTRHMGDMGNWTVAANGTISQSKTLDLLMLTGGTSIIGRAVVLHQAFDDCVTQTTGNAGTKLAHCVIGIADPGATDTNGAMLDDPTLTSAVCVLTPSSGSTLTGLVVLTQADATSPVRVQASIDGLTGPHGFHIHAFGDVSSATGTAAGAHYNPLNAPHHAIPPFPVRHMGDLGNIVYINSNTGYYDYTNDKLSLSGEYSIIGRAMIVHSAMDDCTTPIGNSGSRVAQCVIGVKNPATVGPTIPAQTPTTQDATACDALYTLEGTGPTSTGEGDSSFASVNSVAYGLLALALVFAALF